MKHTRNQSLEKQHKAMNVYLKKRCLWYRKWVVLYRCVWLRHDLETFKKRLIALETQLAQDVIILTESQIVGLERKKVEQESRGEIETQHPGYLGVQDTNYVGTIKGVGRIYQQPFIDTYSKRFS